MICYVVENDASVDAILASPEFHSGRDVVVCLNHFPYHRLSQLGEIASVRFIEDFFSQEDNEDLHQAVDEMLTAWPRHIGFDSLEHDGLPFDEIVEITFLRFYLFHIAIKWGELLRRIKQEYPEIRLLAHDLTNETSSFYTLTNDRGWVFDKQQLMRSVCGQIGLAIRHLPPPSPVPSAYTSPIPHTESQPLTLFERLQRRLLYARNFLVPGHNRDQAYLFYYFNQRLLLHAFKGGVVASGFSWRDLLGKQRYLAFEELPSDHRPEDKTFLEGLAKRADALTDYLGGKGLTWRGIDYAPLFFPACAEVLRTQVPRVLRYARQMQSGIRRLGVSTVVLNDVMTEMGKTQIAVCRSLGVRTAFVDHGIMPIRNRLAASRGINPDCILKPDAFDLKHDPYPYGLDAQSMQLGNPVMDFYAKSMRKRVKTVRKVMILPYSCNYYARMDQFSYQEGYYLELFSVVPRLLSMGVKVVVRPHGERQQYFNRVFRLLSIDTTRLVWSPWSKRFNQAIREVDLLVCHASSTYYEALAAGVPAVFFDPAFNPDAHFPPITGRNYDEVIRISSGQELVDLVSRNRLDASELRNWVEHFLNKHAPRYLGPLDGGASRRIAAVLENRSRL